VRIVLSPEEPLLEEGADAKYVAREQGEGYDEESNEKGGGSF